MPEITVLMPVRNGKEFIKESIDSVLNQSFTDFEFLIINNNESVELDLKLYPHIRCVQSFNEGIAQARGNYIAIVNAGDRMHTERLRIQLKRMKLNPDITVCATWVKPFRTAGAPLPPLQSGEYFIDNPILQMLIGNFIINTSVMIIKQFLERAGLVFEDYPYAEDFKLWFEIVKHEGRFFIEPQCLTFFRIVESDTNIKNEMMEQITRIKREILNYLLKCDESAILSDLHFNLDKIEKEGLILADEIFQLFYTLLKRKQAKKIINIQSENIP